MRTVFSLMNSLLGDVLVVGAAGDQIEDLALARGERLASSSLATGASAARRRGASLLPAQKLADDVLESLPGGLVLAAST